MIDDSLTNENGVVGTVRLEINTSNLAFDPITAWENVMSSHEDLHTRFWRVDRIVHDVEVLSSIAAEKFFQVDCDHCESLGEGARDPEYEDLPTLEAAAKMISSPPGEAVDSSETVRVDLIVGKRVPTPNAAERRIVDRK